MISKGRSAAFLLLVSALWPAASRAATVTVTGNGDTIAVDGAVTLREAIASINGSANVNVDVVAIGTYGAADAIHFAIPGAGVHTIQPASQLVITKPVTINGYSQSGSSANSLAVGNNAVLTIELDGSNAGSVPGGLLKLTGGSSTVRGLVVNRSLGTGGYGLELSGGGGNTVAGNFIGSDPTGTVAHGSGCQSLHVEGAGGNTIGGAVPADRNLITAGGAQACGHNLVILSSNDHVLNNYIGTNAAGSAGLGTNAGIALDGGANAVIGGTAAAERNVISGCTGAGITIFSPASGNVVQGNFIGTDASGTAAIANGKGVQISSLAHDNVIGGTAAGAGNRIAFNTGAGVDFRPPPFNAAAGNTILGNSIYSNGGPGIDFDEDGVTPNDACDGDTGNNNRQNFPEITAATATASSVTVQGTLNSIASTGPYRIEVFANDVCDASGYGEGKTFLGGTTASTGAGCDGSWSATFPVSVSPTAKLTATATATDGSTSEFSACFGVQTVFYTVAPCRVADTRDPPGPSGGPALSANTVRTFPVTGICGIPISARAVAINMAVFNPSNDGDLRVYPAGGTAPLASAINFRPGIVRANNAVVPLGTAGEISVQCDMPSGSTNFFFDVYGYFQ